MVFGGGVFGGNKQNGLDAESFGIGNNRKETNILCTNRAI